MWCSQKLFSLKFKRSNFLLRLTLTMTLVKLVKISSINFLLQMIKNLYKSISNPSCTVPWEPLVNLVWKNISSIHVLKPQDTPDLMRIFTMFALRCQTDRPLSTHPGEPAAWAASLPVGMESELPWTAVQRK